MDNLQFTRIILMGKPNCAYWCCRFDTDTIETPYPLRTTAYADVRAKIRVANPGVMVACIADIEYGACQTPKG